MALHGRRAAVDDLEGDDVPVLAAGLG